MISVRNIRRACLAALDRHLEANRATYSEEDAASAALEMVQFFHEPDLFIANRQLEVFTGVWGLRRRFHLRCAQCGFLAQGRSSQLDVLYGSPACPCLHSLPHTHTTRPHKPPLPPPPNTTGVDKQTGTPCFLLDLDGSRALTKVLERRLRGVDMSGAMALITAGLTNQPPKYDMLQQVEIANENQYRGVVNKFSKMARQSKSQVG